MSLPEQAKPIIPRRALMLAIASILALNVQQAWAQAFPASFNISELDGSNGFRLDGAAQLDRSGYSVSGAGDINGDGINDLIVGAFDAYSNNLDAGSSYVVFGKSTPFSERFALSSLTGTNGFRLDGVASLDYSGFSVSGAGDVNGDGFDDLIIGARFADPNGGGSGSSYVVFGKSTPFAATFSLGSLDGANGFRLDGAAQLDFSGSSVSGAGDVNGDGFADVIIGAPSADPNGKRSGRSYVVFGSGAPFAATLALGSLNGANGFSMEGVAAGDFSGRAVSDAGDINGDGVADLIVGAYFADPNGGSSGSSYVVFGKRTPFAASFALSSLDGSNGFRLDGAAQNDDSGYSVSAAGDINGDGIDDLIVGAAFAQPNGIASGSSYVVFGKRTPFASTLALSTLNGMNGFRIDGSAQNDRVGRSVSAAGDINGDNIDDLIVSALNADFNGSDSGSSYVLFGQRTPFGAALAVSSLDGTNGFRLDGELAEDYFGASISDAGDINGDRIADLIIGASGADPNGGFSGSSYVVFGRDTGQIFKTGFE